VSEIRTSPSPFVAGYRLDRYELLYPIAEGGMAAVWLARLLGKHGFEKLVAVKTILPTYADDPRFRKMFLDEATIASRIEHANVAQILDLGEHEGSLYLVMDWVDGESLSKLERAAERANVAIPTAIVLKIVADACAGLDAAHELTDAGGQPLGVVHRDVSPQNILVTTKGAVKVIDFGIAKARDRSAEETASGAFKGKLHYMAPEQALGKPLDRRADVWAVGAVLYRLLTRRPVYEAENQRQAFQRLASSEPPPALPRRFPRALANVVSQALAFDPSERYASCAALEAALETVMRNATLSATSAEVGAFVSQYLGDQLEARRHAVALAMQTTNEAATLPRRAGEVAIVGALWDSGSASGTELELPRDRPALSRTPTPEHSSLSAGTASIDTRPIPVRPRSRLGAVLVTLGAAVALLVGWWVASLLHTRAGAAPSVANATVGTPPLAVAAAPPMASSSAPTAATEVTTPEAKDPAPPAPPVLDLSAVPISVEPEPHATKKRARPGRRVPRAAPAKAAPAAPEPAALPTTPKAAAPPRSVDDGF